MDSFNLSKVKIEKANAILRFSFQFPVAFKLSGEYFRGLSVALISPRFVFVVGNVIVIILFMKYGRFSSQDDSGNKSILDFCDEHVVSSEKNRNIHGEKSSEEDTIMANMYSSRDNKIYRSHSVKLKREICEKPRSELKRSVTEKCLKSVDYSEKLAAARSYSEDDMSGEEFRRTVEDFIARQQKFLREEP
ncbi:hypothetical protein F0562_028565 [Nyssa sinensis]|uniref:DUF4408 domain-containing protein n=1 Tax=Nyssa sinensis TaxID=561372 RepID=A0A5J5B2S7_9ASTE|nr:hypothetical protein F0562_028565 [Nyssa sinensis]